MGGSNPLITSLWCGVLGYLSFIPYSVFLCLAPWINHNWHFGWHLVMLFMVRQWEIWVGLRWNCETWLSMNAYCDLVWMHIETGWYPSCSALPYVRSKKNGIFNPVVVEVCWDLCSFLVSASFIFIEVILSVKKCPVVWIPEMMQWQILNACYL